MSTVDDVLDRIWRVKRQQPWRPRVLVYWALITLGPLLIGISITVTFSLPAAANGLVVNWVDAMAVLRVLYHARGGNSLAAVDAAQIRLGFDESESLLR